MGRDIISNLDSDATDGVSLANRLTAITNILESANTRLIAIQGAFPPGPPATPQAAALTTIVSQTSQIAAICKTLLGTPAPVPGPA